MPLRTLPSVGMILLAALLLSGEALAKVYASRSEAVAKAFPGATRVEEKSWLLDDHQLKAIEDLARSKIESRIVTIYTGYRGDALLGYALIDVHTVRTLPEAFLVVMTPAGEVEQLRLLAFYEPEEYAPQVRWLSQFRARPLAPSLRLHGEIDGISGATLTARAVTGGVRRALAIHRTLLERRVAAGP
ncbi:MAG: FMN-binding protein [Myxococcales bacterium]|nr:FMN-binding protein [Myxococcales bacterium]